MFLTRFRLLGTPELFFGTDDENRGILRLLPPAP